MNKSPLLAIILILPGLAMAETEFSSLEERMTGKEFQATGLYKLSEEELRTLNRWLREGSLGGSLSQPQAPAPASATPDTAPAVAPATASSAPVPASSTPAPAPTVAKDERGFELKKMREAPKDPITTKIVGDFNGWNGNSVFELENGMIWEQTDDDTFYIRTISNPQVTIKPGMLGTWRMSVEGYGSNVRVRRIQ